MSLKGLCLVVTLSCLTCALCGLMIGVSYTAGELLDSSPLGKHARQVERLAAMPGDSGEYAAPDEYTEAEVRAYKEMMQARADWANEFLK